MSRKNNKRKDHPDFQGWQRRHELRRSGATSPVPGGRDKEAKRNQKHPKKRFEED